MKKWIWLFTLTLLASCLPAETLEIQGNDEPSLPREVVPVELENFGPAPELKNEIWLNTEQPLRLADLGGKVVLLDMWTFG